MAPKKIGIIMNGVTGRMGTNQHLVRSILAIREQGGVALPGGGRLLPDPILVGRNEAKLRELAEAHGVERYSTDLDRCLADPANAIYFDAQTTSRRAFSLRRAIEAGKHVYCEKPVAESFAEALALAKLARDRGVRHGVVQDKLFLPDLFRARRVWLLRFRRRFAAGAAALLELPQGRRRRHRYGYAVALALSARSHLRPGAEGQLPLRDAHPAPLG